MKIPLGYFHVSIKSDEEPKDPGHVCPVRLQLTVRKFVCRNLSCTRRLFTERVPELVAPYARKTQRLIAALQALGVALGGQSGARLAYRLGLPASQDTLWRLVRRLPLPNLPPLSAIEVDDWAQPTTPIAIREDVPQGDVVVCLERLQNGALLAAWASAHHSSFQGAHNSHCPASIG